MLRITTIALFLCCACGGEPPPMHIEDWIRVGLDRRRETDAVIDGLVRAGYDVVERVDGPGFSAIGFARFSDGRRAIRVVTRLGMVVALDSLESDGLRVRHGDVALVDVGTNDLDRDGRPEVVVMRERPTRCIAVLRIDRRGRASAVSIDAAAIAPGSCASAMEDVDGDRRFEALVTLSWPELAIGSRVPSVRAVLSPDDGAWRQGGMPAAFVERELATRTAALAAARAQLDVANAHRLGVELAAIANLTGASRAAQVERYDEAMAGLVVREADDAQIRRARSYIAGGWGAPGE